MTSLRAVAASTIVTLGVAACGGDDSNVLRGRGLSVATVAATDQAHIYEAAARGAFDVDNTPLLIDRRLLPREAGLGEGGRVPDSVVAELRRRNAVRGICEPALTGVVGAPKCDAEFPGYILRYSPVLALGRDSVEVYLFVQKYDTERSGNNERLRFERAYQVVRRDGDWRATMEGRIPAEVRGERR